QTDRFKGKSSITYNSESIIKLNDSVDVQLLRPINQIVPFIAARYFGKLMPEWERIRTFYQWHVEWTQRKFIFGLAFLSNRRQFASCFHIVTNDLGWFASTMIRNCEDTTRKAIFIFPIQYQTFRDNTGALCDNQASACCDNARFCGSGTDIGSNGAFSCHLPSTMAITDKQSTEASDNNSHHSLNSDTPNHNFL